MPPRVCRSCTYRIVRVVGFYRTASDRTQSRKNVAWIVVVKGDPQFKGESSLELRFVQERGRWVLAKMLQDGIRR
jgi:hypothetical protein